jgi:hypothetical protein
MFATCRAYVAVAVEVGPGAVVAHVVGDHHVAMAIAARLCGTPAWSQAVEHAWRHVDRGEASAACGPECTV